MSPGPRLEGFPRPLALLVAGALFMEILDATVIAPALPAIAASLGVEPVAANVAISAYLLTVAVLIPASGWMADRFGARRVFLAALAVFTVASLGCALSQSLPMLVATRVLQGVGGAMMVPVGRLVVLASVAKPDLMRAIAYLTWPALTAPLLAPVVGGAIATAGSWRAIFLLNVPLGIVAFALAWRLMPRVGRRPRRPLDRAGLLALGAGIAALVVTVESVHPGGTRWGFVAAGAAVAAALLGVAVWHLLRARHPLVNLRVLRVRGLRVSVAGGGVYRLVITAVPFVLLLRFQLSFGWTAFLAGAVVAALFAGNVVIKPATTPLMRRFGIKRVLVLTGVASVAWFGVLAAAGPGTPLPAVVAVLFVSGALRSVGFTAYNTLAFADVAAGELPDANTLNATAHELAAGLGIAAAALALTGFGAAAAEGAYAWTFVLLGAVLAASVVEAARLPPDAGAAVTSGR